MRMTRKQLQIIWMICKGNGNDAEAKLIPLDLDQLIERCDWNPSKQSIQFSIRALVKHKLISKGGQEIRRGRKRVVFFPSDEAREMVMNSPAEGILEPENSCLDDNFLAPATLFENIE